ncbi:hypothetical protein FVE85_6655 [Porphyridium purpureum]|uniref:Uncharacterized protein n=1 Tax=Porphyridium purpureum TaxID=35688 RepID=A0A5J4Z7D4_PORPP|nr:hypothetical protein FVE85_6655 [Porphyridium purpureum]|eukprot:POR7874..scf295_1
MRFPGKASSPRPGTRWCLASMASMLRNMWNTPLLRLALASILAACSVGGAPVRDSLIGVSGGGRQTFSQSVFIFSSDLPSQFEPAVERAKLILEETWLSLVPVNVRLVFDEQLVGSALYGVGSPSDTMPYDGSYYTISAAEALARAPLNAEDAPDIIVRFNPAQNWHTQFNEVPPGRSVDFLTVLLHEVMHGLVFVGLAQVSEDGQRVALNPFDSNQLHIFDMFLASKSQKCVLRGVYGAEPDYKSANREVYLAATSLSDLVFLWSDRGVLQEYLLHAPSDFTQGVSIYHMSVSPQDPMLMSPGIQDGVQIHRFDTALIRMIDAMIYCGADCIPTQLCAPGTFSEPTLSPSPTPSPVPEQMIAGLPVPAFIGLVVGCAVAAIIISFLGIYCFVVNKRQEKREQRARKREQREMYKIQREQVARSAARNGYSARHGGVLFTRQNDSAYGTAKAEREEKLRYYREQKHARRSARRVAGNGISHSTSFRNRASFVGSKKSSGSGIMARSKPTRK